MALRKERLESYKKLLLAKQAALAGGIRQTNSELMNDDEPFYTDAVDQASVDSDKTLALQIKDKEHQVLAQIESALKKIDAGTFGVCENCEEPISDARIKANPSVTLCIDCQVEYESEKQRFSHRN